MTGNLKREVMMAAKDMAIEQKDAEIAQLREQLAAYEAQPVVQICQLTPGKWTHLIERPHSTANLDAIKQEVRDKALEDAAEYEEVSRWRPIETAPKDGTDLLLWCGWCIIGFRDENGFWTEDGTQSIQMVTHWIPSPPPPGEEQSNG